MDFEVFHSFWVPYWLISLRENGVDFSEPPSQDRMRIPRKTAETLAFALYRKHGNDGKSGIPSGALAAEGSTCMAICESRRTRKKHTWNVLRPHIVALTAWHP